MAIPSNAGDHYIEVSRLNRAVVWAMQYISMDSVLNLPNFDQKLTIC